MNPRVKELIKNIGCNIAYLDYFPAYLVVYVVLMIFLAPWLFVTLNILIDKLTILWHNVNLLNIF